MFSLGSSARNGWISPNFVTNKDISALQSLSDGLKGLTKSQIKAKKSSQEFKNSVDKLASEIHALVDSINTRILDALSSGALTMIDNLPQYAGGGVITGTQIAMLGENGPESVFSTADAQKLWQLVSGTGDLTGLVANNIIGGLRSMTKLPWSDTISSSPSVVNDNRVYVGDIMLEGQKASAFMSALRMVGILS